MKREHVFALYDYLFSLVLFNYHVSTNFCAFSIHFVGFIKLENIENRSIRSVSGFFTLPATQYPFFPPLFAAAGTVCDFPFRPAHSVARIDFDENHRGWRMEAALWAGQYLVFHHSSVLSIHSFHFSSRQQARYAICQSVQPTQHPESISMKITVARG